MINQGEQEGHNAVDAFFSDLDSNRTEDCCAS